jgi:hypothetical protein
MGMKASTVAMPELGIIRNPQNLRRRSPMERRNFIRAATTAAGMALSTSLFPSPASAADAGSGMIYRTLGSTGERVSALGMGGYHIGNSSLSEEDSIRLV